MRVFHVIYHLFSIITGAKHETGNWKRGKLENEFLWILSFGHE